MPPLLLRVAATWSLPGLGLLALPQEPAAPLAAYALHAALLVEAVLPDGTRHAARATVEEITRPEESTASTRGLLLDFAGPLALPPGTTIWLAQAGSKLGSA